MAGARSSTGRRCLPDCFTRARNARFPWRRCSQIVDAAEGFVVDSPERERSTTSIGELIMLRLKEIDTVAYIRFASVYRDFKDVNEFKEELEGLLRGKDPKTRRHSSR